MDHILVAGLVNVETTVPVHKFPIEFTPIHYRFFGLRQGIAGAGFNIAKTLTSLGDNIKLLSFMGNDIQAKIITEGLCNHNIKADNILPNLKETPQSVMLYDNGDYRQVYFDLKELQEITYDDTLLNNLIEDATVVALTNMNFTRPILLKAKEKNKKICSYVNIVGDWLDSYNTDFMKHSDLLFLNEENIVGTAKSFLKKISKLYQNQIIIIGQGKKGCLMYVRDDNNIRNYPMVTTRRIVNTFGVNEVLFASFLHYYKQTQSPYEALENAMFYASYKIGEEQTTEGFLTAMEFEQYKLEQEKMNKF